MGFDAPAKSTTTVKKTEQPKSTSQVDDDFFGAPAAKSAPKTEKPKEKSTSQVDDDFFGAPATKTEKRKSTAVDDFFDAPAPAKSSVDEFSSLALPTADDDDEDIPPPDVPSSKPSAIPGKSISSAKSNKVAALQQNLN